MNRGTSTQRGGLAPYQERCAKELMAANLTEDISLLRVATACGLSARHFTRAFRQSTGLSPHRWLIEYRVERAKGLLIDSRRRINGKPVPPFQD
jgi:transcriptional regulator GlxA family with amidase domain